MKATKAFTFAENSEMGGPANMSIYENFDTRAEAEEALKELENADDLHIVELTIPEQIEVTE